MSYVNIEGKQGLVRDLNSGAILNTNRYDYDNYLAKKKQRQEEKQRMESQSQEINNIKSELAEIKQLLVTLLSKDNG